MEPLDFALQPLDPLQDAPVARGLGVLEVLGQEVEVQRERRERVADLMGQPAGELGDLGVLGAEPAGDFRLLAGLAGARERGSPAPCGSSPAEAPVLGPDGRLAFAGGPPSWNR